MAAWIRKNWKSSSSPSPEPATAWGSAAAQCQSFTVEAAGQKLTTETTPADAATNGDESFAALTRQSLATGGTLTGIQGNLAATAVRAGPAVTQEASAELTQLINTILAHG
jgi:hypothetical protein